MRYTFVREQIASNWNVLDDVEKKGLITQGLGICYDFPIRLNNWIGYFGWHQLSRSGLPKLKPAILYKYYYNMEINVGP